MEVHQKEEHLVGIVLEYGSFHFSFHQTSLLIFAIYRPTILLFEIGSILIDCYNKGYLLWRI